MATAGQWWQGARPRTLPAAIAPVAVGSGVAAFGGAFDLPRALLALAVALLLQVGVNYANDYSDGVRGTDNERVGPVRLTATGLAVPKAVRSAALACFGAAGVVGLTLIALTGEWWLVAVGLAAVLAAWFYTGGSHPYGYLGLGEVGVFLFFGVVATVGTAYVQTLQFTGLAWLAATGVGALACALLVVNNLRDIPSDSVTGKRTLAVRIGDQGTRILYVGLVSTALLVLVAVAVGWTEWALLALIGFIPAVPPVGAVAGGARGRELIPVLVATGRCQLLYGLLLGLGLALG